MDKIKATTARRLSRPALTRTKGTATFRPATRLPASGAARSSGRATSSGRPPTPCPRCCPTCRRTRSSGSAPGERGRWRSTSKPQDTRSSAAPGRTSSRSSRSGGNIAVTNPPYSRKNEFLERAYSLGKPFAFLMPVEALGGRRVLLYRRHGIELLVPSKRVNFDGEDGELPLGAGFPTAWFCHGLLPRQLLFVEADW